MVILLSLLALDSLAQRTFINREWVQFTGLPDAINYSASILDNQENLVVASNIKANTNNSDILLTKYNPDGVIIWNKTYNGTAIVTFR